MVSSLRDVAYLLARKTADEYRNKGYKVSLDMPLDFLPGFRADVVVSKDGETKVIEVKSRSSLGANPKIVELARIIDTKPGWSFDLVLVAEPEIVDSPQGAHPFKDEAILQRIEEAENTLAAGILSGCFLASVVGLRGLSKGFGCGGRHIGFADYKAGLRPQTGSLSGPPVAR